MIKLQPRGERSQAMALLSPILAGLLTLISGAILFAVLGHDPIQALHTILIKPVSDLYGVSELCIKATPILLCAIGLAVVYRAQVWNIGAEGQLLMGALTGSYAALQLMDFDSYWVLPVILVAGMAGGAIWAALAAWLKTTFNANEILTTIMLNYIALNLLSWAVRGPLKDPDGYNFPESAMFNFNELLPSVHSVFPFLFDDSARANIGLFLGLLAVAVVWVLLSRSFLGYQIKVLGLDMRAARMAGFHSKKLIWGSMLISGALAGLAGVGEVTGPLGQLVPQVSPGYGYAAIIVAFLGRLHPLGILLASLLMSLIYMGGEMAQMDLQMPVALTSMFQGMLLFYLLACDVLINFRLTWRDNRKLAANGAANEQGA